MAASEENATATVETPATAVAMPSATEAGTRYGQALGVALMCYELKTTPAVDELKAKFAGADLAAFNQQAETIVAMWKEAMDCTKSGGPNECRLTHYWSCQEALKEIGPEGTRLPGLVSLK